ncbi:AAA family ATPase [Adhaeribacter soli]|uniref:AAA family ATPase n=1 Tax=Adhaeribacter soli TaxID=2607655 RepID=A0A5N1J1F5_9BACT|nr:AAA family ATPase [Adhaeribacter soli]KAA9340238.1 AAA family ATPase [Adhaeribacter soli]
MITDLIIRNFKSLKLVSLKTKRVNLLIGYPNVGKSNVLEALSLLSSNQHSQKFMRGYVRYDDIENLFYENDSSETIKVETNVGVAYLEQQGVNSLEFIYSLLLEAISGDYIESLLDKESRSNALIKHIQSQLARNRRFNEIGNALQYKMDVNGVYKEKSDQSGYNFVVSNPKGGQLVKKYEFKSNDTFKNKYSDFLLPPFGDNLFTILELNEDLYNNINQLLASNDLELVLRVKERKLEVQRKKGAKVYAFPYTSIADTIQRLAFYLAAIYSNKNSVLLFEEPEAHSFPPFVQMLASRIAADTSNQYFITTHSPYIFDTLLERLGKDEIAVHVCSYQDDQTHIRTLSEEELANVQNMREEIFFNLEKYS